MEICYNCEQQIEDGEKYCYSCSEDLYPSPRLTLQDTKIPNSVFNSIRSILRIMSMIFVLYAIVVTIGVIIVNGVLSMYLSIWIFVIAWLINEIANAIPQNQPEKIKNRRRQKFGLTDERKAKIVVLTILLMITIWIGSIDLFFRSPLIGG